MHALWMYITFIVCDFQYNYPMKNYAKAVKHSCSAI